MNYPVPADEASPHHGYFLLSRNYWSGKGMLGKTNDKPRPLAGRRSV
jgi:hypothetical protein